MSSYAAVNAGIAETVDAGRTVEAYRLGDARVRRTDNAIKRWISWERYTLYLRTVFFPSIEISYVLPLAAVLALGGWLYTDGQVSLAQVTAAVLYTQMLIEPVDIILMWYDELQVGQASMARLHRRPRCSRPSDRRHARATGGRPARARRPVRLPRGARRAARRRASTSSRETESRSSGPPAPVSRRWAGCWPGLHAPRTGTIDMGGVALGLDCRPRRCAGTSPS